MSPTRPRRSAPRSSGRLPSDRAPDKPDSAAFDSSITHDGVRVPMDPASIAARQRRDRAARGNLAAMVCDHWGVDPGSDRGSARAKAAARDFAQLAAALGLEPAP